MTVSCHHFFALQLQSLNEQLESTWESNFIDFAWYDYRRVVTPSLIVIVVVVVVAGM